MTLKLSVFRPKASWPPRVRLLQAKKLRKGLSVLILPYCIGGVMRPALDQYQSLWLARRGIQALLKFQHSIENIQPVRLGR